MGTIGDFNDTIRRSTGTQAQSACNNSSSPQSCRMQEIKLNRVLHENPQNRTVEQKQILETKDISQTIQPKATELTTNRIYDAIVENKRKRLGITPEIEAEVNQKIERSRIIPENKKFLLDYLMKINGVFHELKFMIDDSYNHAAHSYFDSFDKLKSFELLTPVMQEQEYKLFLETINQKFNFTKIYEEAIKEFERLRDSNILFYLDFAFESSILKQSPEFESYKEWHQWYNKYRIEKGEVPRPLNINFNQLDSQKALDNIKVLASCRKIQEAFVLSQKLLNERRTLTDKEQELAKNLIPFHYKAMIKYTDDVFIEGIKHIDENGNSIRDAHNVNEFRRFETLKQENAFHLETHSIFAYQVEKNPDYEKNLALLLQYFLRKTGKAEIKLKNNFFSVL